MVEKNLLPRWTPRLRTGLDGLILIASAAVRNPGVPPGETLGKFLDTHRSSLQEYSFLCTCGTYLDTILAKAQAEPPPPTQGKGPLAKYALVCDGWKPERKWMKYGYVLRPGKLGGIIEAAEHLEESAGVDRVSVLIFLTDPDDLEESYPEDRALIRSAIRNNVVFLPTRRTASHWAAFEANGAPRTKQKHTAATVPENETLALIAHNNKKLDLCRWVVEHRHKIKRFRTIITTGTTGSWIERFLLASGLHEKQIRVIQPMASGPFGGDVEIAGEVLRRKCQHIVFFVDPDTSHAHEVDIQALLRTCTMPDVSVNLRTTETAANSWIASIPR